MNVPDIQSKQLTVMWQPEYLDEIIDYLRSRFDTSSIEAAVILGSGLGGFEREISKPESIPYSSIPHFPNTTVAGHSGSLIFGHIGEFKIIAFAGRFHHYEGHEFSTTTIPVQLAEALKVKKLIISNAAGGINENFHVGDLMVIDDVIRLGISATQTHLKPFRYNHYQYVEKVRDIASELGIKIQRGNYVYVTGPNYETPAEINAFRRLGADAVGMSTVPELMEAARLGLKSVAISLISNAASGMNDEPLNHEEVKAAAQHAEKDFSRLVRQLIEEL